MFFSPAGSPCGIGGPSNPGGPCTGTIGPSDAGKGAFDLLSSASIIHAILAAGAVIAGVIFAIWIVRKVAKFFDGKKASVKCLTEQDDEFWRKVGEADRAARDPDERAGDAMKESFNRDFDFEGFGRAYGESDADSEDDEEDDRLEELDYEDQERGDRAA